VDRGGADPFAGLKEASEEYTVYDPHYEKLGKVDDLIMGEDDRVLYVGVKSGLFGTNSTLIPAEIIRVNDRRHLVEVSEPAETVRHAPHFGKSEELTTELVNHVRNYFGLEGLGASPEHEARDPHLTAPDDQVDLAPGERASEQDRSSLSPRGAEGGAPEKHPGESPPRRAEGREPERESISEPLNQPKSPWERLTTGGGVTVHRLRR
jgi:hypothetical protein